MTSPVASGIDAAVSGNPRILDTPGLAMDAGSSEDPETYSQILSHASDTLANGDAIDQSNADDSGGAGKTSAQDQALLAKGVPQAEIDAYHKFDSGIHDSFFNQVGKWVENNVPGTKTIARDVLDPIGRDVATPVGQGIATGASDALHYLGSPLREVQRDYRYLHLVYTKRGVVQGLLSTLPVVGGAAIGAYAGGGPTGAIIGGEGGGYTSRLIGSNLGSTNKGGPNMKNAGLAALAEESKDPKLKISIGRDFANLLGANGNTDSGWGRVVSGATDLGADFGLDPIVAASKARVAYKIGDLGMAADSSKALAQKAISEGKAEPVLSKLGITDNPAANKAAAAAMTSARSLFNGDYLRTMQSNSIRSVIQQVNPALSTTDVDGITRLAQGLPDTATPGAKLLAKIPGATPNENGFQRFLTSVVKSNNALKDAGDAAHLQVMGEGGSTAQGALPPGFTRGTDYSGNNPEDLVSGTAPSAPIPPGFGQSAGFQEKLTKAERAQALVDTRSTSLVMRYPQLQDIAGQRLLGIKADQGVPTSIDGLAAATGDASVGGDGYNKAAQVFTDIASRQEFADRLATLSILPTRALGRVPFAAANAKLQSIGANSDRIDQPSVTGAVASAGFSGVAGVAKAAKDLAVGGVGGTRLNLAFNDVKDAKSAAGKALADAFSRKYTTFTNKQAFAFDPKLDKLSTSTFSLNNVTMQQAPFATRGIYNMLKYSMSENNARYYTEQMINAPNYAASKRIWDEAHVEAIKAAGAIDDPETIKQIQNIIAGSTTRPYGMANSEYAHGEEMGSQAAMGPNGEKMALSQHQTNDEFAFMPFQSVKQVMRASENGFKANYGRADDFVYRHYIGSLFKPMALLNTGFGIRVALAEQIPEIIRNGALNTMRNQLAAHVARTAIKQGRNGLDKVNPNESDHIIAAAVRALSKPAKAAEYKFSQGLDMFVNNPTQRERALDLVIRHQGHLVAGAGLTGEDTASPVNDSDPQIAASQNAHITKALMRKDPAIGWKNSGDFTTLTPGNNAYPEEWQTQLSKHSNEKWVQTQAQDLLDRKSESQIKQEEAARINKALTDPESADPAYVQDSNSLAMFDHIRAKTPMDDGGVWNAHEVAARRLDALKGLTTGNDGTIHDSILHKLSNGEAPELSQLEAVAPKALPRAVIAPVIGQGYLGSAMQRLISGGFKKLVDPVVNNLSRDPMYFNEYSQQMDQLQPLIDSGHFDEGTVQRIAETRANISMLPKIHNVVLRSQFSMLARNYMPFYFAQEQALRRSASLILSNPQAIRQYQLYEQGLNDPGFVHTDQYGNKYFMLPGVGAVTKGVEGLMNLGGASVVSGLPVSGAGAMTSLATTAPDLKLPGVSPLVSIPLKTLSNIFPELQEPVKSAIGDQSFGAQALDSLLPSPAIKAAWRAMSGDEKDASFANATATALMSAYYHGDVPGANASLADKANFINKIRNNARSTFIVKGIVGMLSPVAPQVQYIDQGLSDEWHNMVNEVTTKGGDYQAALQKFLTEHGDKAISYTVGKTAPTVPGTELPYSRAAYNMLQDPKFQSLINSQYGNAAAYLLPMSPAKDGDTPLIQGEYLRDHLRQTRTPQQFLDAVDTAIGNQQIAPDEKVHEAALKAVQGNSQATDAENASWSQHLFSMQLMNPTWYAQYSSTAKSQQAQEIYANLHEVFSKGLAPAGKQSDETYALMNDYDTHLEAMAALTGKQRTAEGTNWQNYLDSQVESHPELTSVINTVFSHLDNTGLETKLGLKG